MPYIPSKTFYTNFISNELLTFVLNHVSIGNFGLVSLSVSLVLRAFLRLCPHHELNNIIKLDVIVVECVAIFQLESRLLTFVIS